VICDLCFWASICFCSGFLGKRAIPFLNSGNDKALNADWSSRSAIATAAATAAATATAQQQQQHANL